MNIDVRALALVAALLLLAFPAAAAVFSGLNTGQVSVGTAPTLIAAQRIGRGQITITNTAAAAVYIGGPDVTSSTGEYLAGEAGASLTLDTQAAVYGVVGSSSETVGFAETY